MSTSDADRLVLMLAALVTAACTKPNPAYCSVDTDCSNGLRCDVPTHNCVSDPDAAVMPDALECYGAGGYRVCPDNVDPAPLVIDRTYPNDINTDTSAYCAAVQPAGWIEAGQAEACFIIARAIDVTSIDAWGSRPLVVLATENLHVGRINAASEHNGDELPSDPQCVQGTAPAANSSGSGGGAGGSFITKGGDGGRGNSNATAAGTAGDALVGIPSKLRFGCEGQDGGGAGSIGTNARRGAAGGAVYLLAGITLDLRDGKINVSGGGGHLPGGLAGAGGGGSGGMLVLYAPAIRADVDTWLEANGGGGGGGAGDGADPGQPNVSAIGGPPNSSTCMNQNGGGAGYSISAAATSGSSATTVACGGGGGGGGAGYIQANMSIPVAISSPATNVVP